MSRSDCRGVNRDASAPNRARSNRGPSRAMISIPQHAVPNDIGQRLFFWPHRMTSLTLVTRKPSFKAKPRNVPRSTTADTAGRRNARPRLLQTKDRRQLVRGQGSFWLRPKMPRFSVPNSAANIHEEFCGKGLAKTGLMHNIKRLATARKQVFAVPELAQTLRTFISEYGKSTRGSKGNRRAARGVNTE